MRGFIGKNRALALGASLLLLGNIQAEEKKKSGDSAKETPAKSSIFSLPWSKEKAGETEHKDGDSPNRKASKGKDSDMEALEKMEISSTERKAALQEQATLRLKEEEDYFRRLEVCDKLMVEAVRNGDTEAQRRIEQQQDRIQEIYNGRTAFIRLPEGSKRDLAILQDKIPGQKATTANSLLKTNSSGKDSRGQTASLKEGR